MLLRQIKMNKIESEFVDKEIEKLLQTECITEISKPLPNGWTSNIFLVPKKDLGLQTNFESKTSQQIYQIPEI